MEWVRSEPKYAELAYFRSILGNTGTQKRKALLLPSFVCQFPRDGDRQYIGEVKSRETISYPISDKISHTTLTKSQAKSHLRISWGYIGASCMVMVPSFLVVSSDIPRYSYHGFVACLDKTH
jgi:hypothetical protein